VEGEREWVWARSAWGDVALGFGRSPSREGRGGSERMGALVLVLACCARERLSLLGRIGFAVVMMMWWGWGCGVGDGEGVEGGLVGRASSKDEAASAAGSSDGRGVGVVGGGGANKRARLALDREPAQCANRQTSSSDEPTPCRSLSLSQPPLSLLLSLASRPARRKRIDHLAPLSRFETDPRRATERAHNSSSSNRGLPPPPSTPTKAG
jgi:hypothetical protein